MVEKTALSVELIDKKYQLSELKQCLNLIENDFERTINQGNYTEEKSYLNVVLHCAGKSILTMREIIILCENGMPDGALGLSRNIFEQFIIIYFFESKTIDEERDKLVEKYLADYEMKRLMYLKEVYKYANKQSENEQYQKELDNQLNYFYVKKYKDYWWSGANNFGDLCRNVIDNVEDECKPMVNNMHLSYKRACLSLHASHFGNANRLTESYPDIDISPSNRGQQFSLDLAVKSLIMVVMVAYKLLNIPSKEVNKRLNDLAIFYQELTLTK